MNDLEHYAQLINDSCYFDNPDEIPEIIENLSEEDIVNIRPMLFDGPLEEFDRVLAAETV